MSEFMQRAWDMAHAVWDGFGIGVFVLVIGGLLFWLGGWLKDLAMYGWREVMTPTPLISDKKLVEAHHRDWQQEVADRTFAPPKKHALDTSALDLAAIRNNEENGDTDE